MKVWYNAISFVIIPKTLIFIIYKNSASKLLHFNICIILDLSQKLHSKLNVEQSEIRISHDVTNGTLIAEIS